MAESEGGREDLVGEYPAILGSRSAFTVEVYGRILRSLAGWVAERPVGVGGFRPDLFTRTAVETYPKELEARGYSVSHRSRVKSVASGFAQDLCFAGKLVPWRHDGTEEDQAHLSEGYSPKCLERGFSEVARQKSSKR